MASKPSRPLLTAKATEISDKLTAAGEVGFDINTIISLLVSLLPMLLGCFASPAAQLAMVQLMVRRPWVTSYYHNKLRKMVEEECPACDAESVKDMILDHAAALSPSELVRLQAEVN